MPKSRQRQPAFGVPLHNRSVRFAFLGLGSKHKRLIAEQNAARERREPLSELELVDGVVEKLLSRHRNNQIYQARDLVHQSNRQRFVEATGPATHLRKKNNQRSRDS